MDTRGGKTSRRVREVVMLELYTCTCNVKDPDLAHHNKDCDLRMATEMYNYLEQLQTDCHVLVTWLTNHYSIERIEANLIKDRINRKKRMH